MWLTAHSRRCHPSCLLQKRSPGLRPHLPNPPFSGGAGNLADPAERTLQTRVRTPGAARGSRARVRAAALTGRAGVNSEPARDVRRCKIRAGRGDVRRFALCRSGAAGMRATFCCIFHDAEAENHVASARCLRKAVTGAVCRALTAVRQAHPVHELRLGDNPELREIVAFRIGPLFMFIHPISY